MIINYKDHSKFENIKQFYNNIYYKDKNANHTNKPHAHLRKLAKKLGINDQSRVLDVACGTGEWLLVCRDAGAIVCGVDISDKAIDVCRESIPDGMFFAQPAETLPFVDNRFDVVTCLGSRTFFTARAGLAGNDQSGKA